MYKRYVHQLLGVFCDRLKFGSIAALECVLARTMADIAKKRLLLLFISLFKNIPKMYPFFLKGILFTGSGHVATLIMPGQGQGLMLTHVILIPSNINRI